MGEPQHWHMALSIPPLHGAPDSNASLHALEMGRQNLLVCLEGWQQCLVAVDCLQALGNKNGFLVFWFFSCAQLCCHGCDCAPVDSTADHIGLASTRCLCPHGHHVLQRMQLLHPVHKVRVSKRCVWRLGSCSTSSLGSPYS